METGILTAIKDICSSSTKIISLTEEIIFSYIVPIHSDKVTYIEYIVTFNSMENIITYEVDTVPGIARNILKSRNGSFVPTKEDIDNIFNIINNRRKLILLRIENCMYCKPNNIVYNTYFKDSIDDTIDTCKMFMKDSNWIC